VSTNVRAGKQFVLPRQFAALGGGEAGKTPAKQRFRRVAPGLNQRRHRAGQRSAAADDIRRGRAGMRRIWRSAATTGLLVLALLPVAAAVSSETAVPTLAAVALTQPFSGAATFFPHGTIPSRWAESGWLLLIGGGLMALGIVARKATRP
jgi:hypothetical protein